jgi:hypothetical protein
MAKHLAPKHGGVYLPGIRDQLRERYAELVRNGDPRAYPEYTHWSSEERRRANANSPVVLHAQRMVEALDAGEDIETGRPSAHHWPELAGVPWYADPSVRRVIVGANDTIRPA